MDREMKQMNGYSADVIKFLRVNRDAAISGSLHIQASNSNGLAQLEYPVDGPFRPGIYREFVAGKIRRGISHVVARFPGGVRSSRCQGFSERGA